MNSSLPLDILNHIYNEYIPRTKFTTEIERAKGLGQPDTCLAEVFPVKLYPVKIDTSKNIIDYSAFPFSCVIPNITFKRSLEEIYILYHHNPEFYHKELEDLKRFYELHLPYCPQYMFDDFEDFVKNYSTKMAVYFQQHQEIDDKIERLALRVISLSDLFE